MYIDSNYDYLLCMLNNLDNEHFGKLIGFIYGKKDNRFINPYKTHRELFINILLNNKDNIYKPLISAEVNNYLKSHKNLKINEGKTNEYLKKILDDLKQRIILKENEDILSINDKDFENRLYSSYNKLILPINSFNENIVFIKYIDTILNSIKSFQIDTFVLKKGFNDLIDFIIEKKKCYKVIDCGHIAKLEEYELLPMAKMRNLDNIKLLNIYTVVQQGENIIIYKSNKRFVEKINNCKRIKGNIKSLINPKVTRVSSLINKLKSIEKAINRLNNNLEKNQIVIKDTKEHICPMCYSEKNINERTGQRCKICKNLRKLILKKEGKETYTESDLKSLQNKIEYINPKIKNSLTNEEKRKKHYDNLKKYLTKLYNMSKSSKNKNEKNDWNRIKKLVNKSFGDIEKFYFN